MKETNNELKQYIVVKLGREQYGININYVQNIVRMQSITRVPKAPFYIKGVINLRGEIIPVMSLRLRFGIEEEAHSNETRIIILKISGHPIGVIVDAVREVIEIQDNEIQTVSRDITDEKSDFVFGIGKNKGELVSLLNLEGVIVVSD